MTMADTARAMLAYAPGTHAERMETMTYAEGVNMERVVEQVLQPGEVAVEMDDKEQGLVVFDGGGPIHLVDQMGPDEVSELVPPGVRRRVLVARLRAWADIIEGLDA